MLGKQISSAREKDRDNGASKLEPKRRLIMKWTPPREKHLYFKQRYGSPRMISRSFPQRKRNLSYYKTKNFSMFDIGGVKGDASFFVSPKSSSENSFNRELSRSAKIMRALSSSSELISHRHRSIRKSLTFSPSPSPQKTNSLNSSISSDSSPMFSEKLMLDSTSTDSSGSMLITSAELIDENQNQTPRHSRKTTNTLTDTTPKIRENADTGASKFKLRSRLKEKIDSIVNNAETPRHSFSKSNIDGCVVLASTPRESSREINQDDHNRSQTPENIMLIPQIMSAIKKSHKKEKLHYFEDLLSTRQMEASIANANLPTKSLEVHDESDSFYNVTPIKESQKKKRVVKKMLTYKDSGLNDDTRTLSMDLDVDGTTLNEDDTESRSDSTQNDKVQNIDSNDHDAAVGCEKSARRSDLTNRNEDTKEDNDCSGTTNNNPEEEESRSFPREEADQRRAVSPVRESTGSQSQGNAATTPENHINLLKQICTESIKKSHKKMKYEKRKALSQISLHQKMEVDKSEASGDQPKDDATTIDATPTSSRQVTSAARPGTPEHLNSSRLLLSQYNSIKKSHKKDKEKKEKITSAIKHRKYSRINSDWLKMDGDGETSAVVSQGGDSSLRMMDSSSPGVSFNKGKRSMSLRGSVRKSKNADDEFKIYTPIKRRPLISLASSANTKQKAEESAPKEIDCFRCTTPVTRREDDVASGRSGGESRAHSSNDNGLADNRGSGASTPTNMSTTELRQSVDSIKASHKKEKFEHGSVIRKQILGKEQQPIETIRNMNFADARSSEDGRSSENDVVADHAVVTGTCSKYTHVDNVDKNSDEGVETLATRRAENSTEDKAKESSNCLVVTPPNDTKVARFIRLSHTNSIKKSHKKERDNRAQAKYIFMSEEHDLSDDGSIFNEEDRLNSVEFPEDPCRDDTDNEMTNSI